MENYDLVGITFPTDTQWLSQFKKSKWVKKISLSIASIYKWLKKKNNESATFYRTLSHAQDHSRDKIHFYHHHLR